MKKKIHVISTYELYYILSLFIGASLHIAHTVHDTTTKMIVYLSTE